MHPAAQTPFAVIAKHQTSAPVDVDAIARDLGIRVVVADLAGAVSGMLVRDRTKASPTGYTIYVNARNPPKKQRFTLAHEIAHFILHRDHVDDRLVEDAMHRSKLGAFHETQANHLTADILMPLMLLKRAWARRPVIEDLASEFRVSPAAMKARIEDLKRQVS